MMQLKKIVLGPYATNCYLLEGTASGSCILVDPADSGEALVGHLEQQNLVPEAVLLTHGHYDHILAVPALQARWPELPVYCHPLDCPAEKEEVDMGQRFPTVSAFANLQPVKEGQTLNLAGHTFTVMHTPGHTPGSVMYQVESTIFSGDTLFLGSIGRTDLPGGNMKQMMQSLVRIAGLPKQCDVYPGHGGATTLAHEHQHNGYLKRAMR